VEDAFGSERCTVLLLEDTAQSAYPSAATTSTVNGSVLAEDAVIVHRTELVSGHAAYTSVTFTVTVAVAVAGVVNLVAFPVALCAVVVVVAAAAAVQSNTRSTTITVAFDMTCATACLSGEHPAKAVPDPGSIGCEPTVVSEPDLVSTQTEICAADTHTCRPAASSYANTTSPRLPTATANVNNTNPSLADDNAWLAADLAGRWAVKLGRWAVKLVSAWCQVPSPNTLGLTF
jgi:hypothetical protein